MLSLCPGSWHTPALLCVPQTRVAISAQVRAGLPVAKRRSVNLCTEIYSYRDRTLFCSNPKLKSFRTSYAVIAMQ